MFRLALLLSALLSSPGLARTEDAAHRADRLRTMELNAQARRMVDRRDRANADVRARNRVAMERYERQRAEWRRRVADCRDGDWNACER